MDQNFIEPLLSIALGMGLAAACGFRIFVPALVVSLASRAGWVDLGESFQWLGSDVALWCLGAATALEIGAYYLPVVDNLLDSVATPAAVLAGAVLSFAVMEELDPFLRWSLAIVAGGSLAAAVQLPTVALRGVSTASSGGLANPVVSTSEAAAATTVSAASVAAPFLVPVIVLAVVWFVYRRLRRAGRDADVPALAA